MDYKHTLNLPKTSFPMKAELPKREPDRLARWEALDLYGQLRKARAGKPRYTLHDGPPYANGDIHIGHALNKILKDIVVRYQSMRGFDAPYVPGWDCHGMPIEHQLFQELKLTKHQIPQAAFREKARAYAQRYVDIQRDQFKRLGVLGDWGRPYLTMGKDYELTILRLFRELAQAGYIYRGKKPVYWCASCETALAEAEVEYADRRDTSIYVKFPLTRPLAGAGDAGVWQEAAVVVWTTTPWTLPANVALCFHPDHHYSLVEARGAGGKTSRLVIAADLVNTVLPKLGLELVRELRKDPGAVYGKATAPGQHALSCRHPFGRPDSIGVTDEGVSLQEGTGIVHIAPGHGQEDYAIGQRYKLEVFSPVDHQGTFTKEIAPFSGQTVFAANPQIIADLRRRGLLAAEEPLTHSYPHCWRCKEPVIFRATPQWFLSVEQDGLRARLLKAVRTVTWIPPGGVNRISGMLESRPDWCLSRQRYWGTPIPVLHCEACNQPILDSKALERIERTLAERGTDFWFTADPAELLPQGCPACRGKTLRKETDILDVWFDSGVSHEAVLKARGGQWPASLYLEGSDQHRGWFQVSLIPSVALHGKPPYERVLTHGFVMDGEGRKMSKSLGNVVAPQDVMTRFGADILRLWVASCDYREDVRISEEILKQVAESYRKIRNTCRYLLANLYDFDPARDRCQPSDWPELDRWALHRTGELLDAVTAAYEASQFLEASRAIHQFCVLDLSAFYLDALKDRLYTEAPTTASRRCAQAAMYDILVTLVKMLAPVLVVTADEVWQIMRDAGWVREPSVHLAEWPKRPDGRLDDRGKARWTTFLAMREVVMKALEEQRGRGVIGSPLEARVTLLVNDGALQRLCESHRETLTEAFVVSDVAVQGNGVPPASEASAAPAGEAGGRPVPGLVGVKVERAPGEKCKRCWKYLTTVGSQPAHPALCGPCAGEVMGQGG